MRRPKINFVLLTSIAILTSASSAAEVGGTADRHGARDLGYSAVFPDNETEPDAGVSSRRQVVRNEEVGSGIHLGDTDLSAEEGRLSNRRYGRTRAIMPESQSSPSVRHAASETIILPITSTEKEVKASQSGQSGKTKNGSSWSSMLWNALLAQAFLAAAIIILQVRRFIRRLNAGGSTHANSKLNEFEGSKRNRKEGGMIPQSTPLISMNEVSGYVTRLGPVFSFGAALILLFLFLSQP